MFLFRSFLFSNLHFILRQLASRGLDAVLHKAEAKTQEAEAKTHEAEAKTQEAEARFFGLEMKAGPWSSTSLTV